MKKVILNKCYGGFGASYLAHKLYAKKKYNVDEIFIYKWTKNGYVKICSDTIDKKLFRFYSFYSIKDFGDFITHEERDKIKDSFLLLDDKYREDPIFIEVVEELGEKANTFCSDLKIVEIPDDLDYVIDDYDGIETLHQKVQEW